MVKGYEAGFSIVGESFKIIRKHPKILAPLVLVSVLFALIALYLRFAVSWDDLDFFPALVLCVIVIFVYAFLLSFSCSMLLELITQIEKGEKARLGKAFLRSLFKDSFRIMPLVFVWAIVWFLISLVEAFILTFIAMVTGKARRYSNSPYSASEASLALAGGGVSVSAPEAATRLSFDLIQRGIRMIIFLILPGIVWDKMGFFKAIKKGLSIFKTNLSQFATGYAITWTICLFLMIPPAIIFISSGILHASSYSYKSSLDIAIERYYDNYCSMTPEEQAVAKSIDPIQPDCPPQSAVSDFGKGKYPDFVWYLVIVYMVLVWAAAIYLEQMFSALLYLWHTKWEQVALAAKAGDKSVPAITDVEPPNILDEVRDVNFI